MRTDLLDAVDSSEWLTVEEAASRLNVKKETIYAYVSRGRLAKQKAPKGRGSVFSADDIERLARSGRQEGKAHSEVESSITFLTDQGHYYRGQRSEDLADSRTFEEVAHLLWGAPAAPDGWVGSPDIEEIARRVVKDLRPRLSRLTRSSSCWHASPPSSPLSGAPVPR